MLALSIHQSANTTLTTSIGILTGVMYWNFTARIVQESVAQFLDDAFSKNLQNLFIAPFSLLELSVSLMLSSVIKLCVSFLFLLLITYTLLPSFFAALTVIHSVLLFELIVFGSILTIYALAIIFLFGARVSFVGWFISTILQVFSCVFFERYVLPGVLYPISYLVPSSYIFEAMRATTSHTLADPHAQYIILSLLGIYFICAVFLLNISYKFARKNAILTKI
jgi:ABC-2 type transport system permease protein